MNGPTDSRRLKLAGVAILALDVCFGVVLLDRVGDDIMVPDSWTAGQVFAVVVVGAPGVAGLLTSAARYVPLFRRGPPGIGD